PVPAGVGITAPLAGNIFKIVVQPGDVVAGGDVVLILEAMKMETEIRAASGGTVSQVLVREGDAVDAGHTLITLG
ncbi:MAG: biotin/lipoyl-containing protein, partial [bacterium]